MLYMLKDNSNYLKTFLYWPYLHTTDSHLASISINSSSVNVGKHPELVTAGDIYSLYWSNLPAAVYHGRQEMKAQVVGSLSPMGEPGV